MTVTINEAPMLTIGRIYYPAANVEREIARIERCDGWRKNIPCERRQFEAKLAALALRKIEDYPLLERILRCYPDSTGLRYVGLLSEPHPPGTRAGHFGPFLDSIPAGAECATRYYERQKGPSWRGCSSLIVATERGVRNLGGPCDIADINRPFLEDLVAA